MFQDCWAKRKGFKIDNPNWMDQVKSYIDKMIEFYKNKI